MRSDAAYDDLAAELHALGRTLPAATPGPKLTDAVLARVTGLAAPGAPTRLDSLRGDVRDALRRHRRSAAAVLTAVALASLSAPPVRATVADWFGFAGVLVRDDPAPTTSQAPPPPTVGSTTTLDEARRLVSFDVLLPTALGPPWGVEVSPDRRVVSMTWTTQEDGVLRLDQFDGRVDYTFAKTSPGLRFVRVGAVDAMWFEEPHEVALLDAEGTRRIETARLAGHTLIWEHGGTALRLEGDVSLGRATAIALSVDGAG
jgi:hypothetical protein